MTEIKLTIHGGGRLQVHGSLSASRILVLLSRDQFQADDLLMAKLVDFLAEPGLAIVRYESEIAVTVRLIDHPAFWSAPKPVRKAIKALGLLCHPTRWRYFSASFRRTQNTIGYRARALTELVQFLGPGKEVIVLGRSAGGRVASLVADHAGIQQLICLGYPFVHPEDGPDPARYSHLADLQTPTLILQGTRDDYGDRTSAGRYRLGPNTTLEWVETDHAFSLSAEEWDRVAARIKAFITAKRRRC